MPAGVYGFGEIKAFAPTPGVTITVAKVCGVPENVGALTLPAGVPALFDDVVPAEPVNVGAEIVPAGVKLFPVNVGAIAAIGVAFAGDPNFRNAPLFALTKSGSV